MSMELTGSMLALELSEHRKQAVILRLEILSAQTARRPYGDLQAELALLETTIENKIVTFHLLYPIVGVY